MGMPGQPMPLPLGPPRPMAPPPGMGRPPMAGPPPGYRPGETTAADYHLTNSHVTWQIAKTYSAVSHDVSPLQYNPMAAAAMLKGAFACWHSEHSSEYNNVTNLRCVLRCHYYAKKILG